MLRGPPADAIAIAGKVEFLNARLVLIGEGDVDKADGLVYIGAGAGGWAGDSGDGDAERRSGARADAAGECAGDGFTDRAVGGDEFGRDVGEGGLESVAVDDGATEEVARASRDGGEARGQETAGRAFGGGEGEVTKAEHEKDDLFQALVLRREDGVFHLGFDATGEFVDAGLRFGERGFGGGEVKLNLSVAGEDGGVDVGVFAVDG